MAFSQWTQSILNTIKTANNKNKIEKEKPFAIQTKAPFSVQRTPPFNARPAVETKPLAQQEMYFKAPPKKQEQVISTLPKEEVQKIKSQQAVESLLQSMGDVWRKKVAIREQFPTSMTYDRIKQVYPEKIKKAEEKYDKDKIVASYLSKVDSAFTESLKGIVGEEQYANREQGQAFSPERAIPRILDSMTLNITNVSKLGREKVYTDKGKLYYNGFPIGDEFVTQKGKRAAMGSDILSSLLGGFLPYAGISSGIKVGLGTLANGTSKLAKVARNIVSFTEKYPFIAEQTGYNIAEETVDMAIRKATGQDYTINDFLAGLALGSISGGAMVIAGKSFKNKEIKKALEEAEAAFRETRDPSAINGIMVGDTPLIDLFKEKRLAYYDKGIKDGTRPGIEKPAPLPGTDIKTETQPLNEGKVEAEKIEPVKLTVNEKRRIEAEIQTELDASQKGERIFANGEVTGISSTFPKWLSSDLKNKKLIDGVLEKLNTGKVKEIKSKKERALLLEMRNEYVNRLGRLGEKGKIIDAGSPVEKLTEAIKKAKLKRGDIEAAYSKERARRSAIGSSILSQAPSEKGFMAALQAQKGALIEKTPDFDPVKSNLKQADVDSLFKSVASNDSLSFYDKISTADGLMKIFDGKIPQYKQLSMLEDVFGKDLISAVISKRPFNQKVKDAALEALNLPRALMTSFDMSAPFRQGILLTAAHPIAGAKAFGEMFSQVFSQKNFDEWFEALKKSPEYKLMKDSDLYIASPNRVSDGLAAKEERFMSNLVDKIPWVKSSNRAYTAYLNKLRTDVFSSISKKFIKQGYTPGKDAKVFKDLATFINSATGRGDLGVSLNRISPLLNTIFFSPRLAASRLNFLNPVWYFKLSKPARLEAIKSFAEFVGVGSAVLGLAKLGGADVELDPRSTDFGKIKVGDTRWDIWGGFQQWVRFFSQVASGKRKTTKGEVQDISKDVYPFESRLDNIIKFARGKLSPMPGLILELMDGQKLFGGEFSLKQELIENGVPLYLMDIKDAYKKWGPSALFTVGLPGFFGIGTQTYDQAEKKSKSAVKKEIKKNSSAVRKKE